jgi:superfamily II DNA or RNA helicase
VPRIYFQQTPTVLDSEEAMMDTGIINTSLLRTQLGRSLASNTFRYWKIKEAVDAGRKVLCVSHSVDQLKLFHAMFPGSSLIIGATPQNKRMDILRDSSICFAVAKLGSTGIDDDRLDTLFWLTPFKSKIALQQSMGRILRVFKDKQAPVFIVFEDWTVPTLRRLCMKLKATLKKWKYVIETCKPVKLPLELPPSVRAAYDTAFSLLPEKGEVVEE